VTRQTIASRIRGAAEEAGRSGNDDGWEAEEFEGERQCLAHSCVVVSDGDGILAGHLRPVGSFEEIYSQPPQRIFCR
jgi:hypothetical protein